MSAVHAHAAHPAAGRDERHPICASRSTIRSPPCSTTAATRNRRPGGTLVQVPFGKRSRRAVCEVTTHTDARRRSDAICTDLPPLSPDWLALDVVRRGLLPARAWRGRAAGAAAGAARCRALGAAARARGALPAGAGRAAARCCRARRAASARAGAGRQRLAGAARGARAAPEGGGHGSTTGRRAAGSTSRRSAGPMRLCPKLWITCWQPVEELCRRRSRTSRPRRSTRSAPRRLRAVPAARRDGQQQDRGLSACARVAARRATGAQALVLVRNQPDAAVRGRVSCASRGARRRCDRHAAGGNRRASVRATGSPRIRAARGSCSARASRCSRRCRRSR